MRCLAALLTLLMLPLGAHAQEGNPPEGQEAGIGRIQFFSGSVGIGGGAAGYGEATFDTNVEATLATRRYALSARFAGATEFEIFGGSGRGVAEVGLLAGIRHHFAGRWLMARAQAGPGLVFEQRRGAPLPRECEVGQIFCFQDYETETSRALGVAGQAELLLTPIPYAGLGLRLAGNVNGARSFGGLSLALHFGRLY